MFKLGKKNTTLVDKSKRIKVLLLKIRLRPCDQSTSQHFTLYRTINIWKAFSFLYKFVQSMEHTEEILRHTVYLKQVQDYTNTGNTNLTIIGCLKNSSNRQQDVVKPAPGKSRITTETGLTSKLVGVG